MAMRLEAAKVAATGKQLMLSCGISLLPLICSVTFMGLYWALFAGAASVNEYDWQISQSQVITNVFDNCNLHVLQTDGSYELADTKWTVVFTLNAVVYTLLTFFTCCHIFAIILPLLAACTVCGLCCTQCAHFAAIVVTGVFRYSVDGEKCAEQTFKLSKFGDRTFEEIGDEMQGIFISQCVLFCFYGCALQFALNFILILANYRKAAGM